MDQANKAVVNLEVSTGFFRIATDQTIYNITVLGASGRSERNTERIVPVQEIESAVDKLPGFNPDPLNTISEIAGDNGDYYKQVSHNIFSDIGKLAKQLSHTIMEIPAEDRLARRVELDEAGERIEEAKNQLKDIVAMTEHATMEIMDRVDKVQAGTSDLQNLLSFLRDHHAFKLVNAKESEETVDANGEDEAIRSQTFADLRSRLVTAGELAASVSTGADQGAVAAGAHRQVRFLFVLDPVLQTMYELCTNETVKKHISSARATAPDIFALDTFIDLLSPRVNKLPVEDGFLTVPLADVLYSLYESCSDKAIKNLLKNMEAKMAQIFLDQYLPLEVPVMEETAIAEPSPIDSPSVELGGIINEALNLVDELATGGKDKTGGSAMSGMPLDDQKEIYAKIENAFQSVSNISSDVFRITESLSFQDLSGQQIMKIIKLLSDFQIQLLAMVVSFGSQLKIKEKNIHITAEESKKLAQNDVDAYINKIMGGATEGGTTLLDQQAVNSMLQEFGF